MKLMSPQIKHRKSTEGESPAPLGVYLAASVVIFFMTLSAADSVGFVPCQIDGTCAATETNVSLSELPQLGDSGVSNTTTSEISIMTTLPVNIKIPAIDLDLPVQNPDSRDLGVLDTLLKKGPARYTESARLGESGNMIIFAHSSHLPIVHNQMYKAFNRIPELKEGDTITLSGDDGTDYLYSVTSVEKVDVSDTTIDLSKTQGTKLTLVTCDTLKGKSARYILTADFVGTVGQ